MAINYPQKYDDDFINIIKKVIDHVNEYGKTIQDLVADGQLTDEQYAKLITTINGMTKSGEINWSDLSDALQNEIKEIETGNEITNERIDNLVLESGGDSNIEVADARFSSVKNKTYNVIGDRINDVEKDSTVILENLVKNGDFSNGSTGWEVDFATLTSGPDFATLTGDGTNQSPSFSQSIQTTEEKVYIKGRFKVNDSNAVAVSLFFASDEIRFNRDVDYLPGEWVDFTRVENIENLHRMKFILRYTSAASATGTMDISPIMIVPISSLSGLVQEVEDMERLLNAYENNYFEGVKNIFNVKDVYRWMTRKNESAATLRAYGAVGDGIADDSDAIQEALNNERVVISTPGTYKITKTITIGSNTAFIGFGSESKFVLGDDFNLTPFVWREGDSLLPDYHPYFVSKKDAENIVLENFLIEGNKNQFVNHIQVGCALESSRNIKVNNVSVKYINYFPDEAPTRPSGQFRTGWNFLTIRSENVSVTGGEFEYGGYEVFRVGDGCRKIKLSKAVLRYGWRTCYQILRDNADIEISDCIIDQDDFGTNDTHAAITLHSAPDASITNIRIKDNVINAQLFLDQPNGGNAISFVGDYKDDIEIADNEINTNGIGMSPRLQKVGKIKRNKINSDGLGINLNTINDSDSIEISDNDIVSMSARALNIIGGTVDTLEVTKNRCQSPHDNGVRIAYAGGRKLIFDDNDVDAEGLSYQFSTASLDQFSFKDNTLKSATNHTTYITDVSITSGMASGNTYTPSASRNGFYTTDLASISDFIVSEEIFKQGDYAISLNDSIVDCIIKGNIVKNTTNGIQANVNNLISDNL